MFRAYDPERDALVAVKLFTIDLAPERADQLVAEFQRVIGLTLIHDAIASPIAAGLCERSPYLAQQYVSGESLDLAIRQYGPAPAVDALRVAAQLAGALDFAAVVHVDHGSLHPRDVLLSPDETKLTGFGVARALEQVGVTAPVRRPYSAPERIAGAAWDRRADIFGLAALIYELLCGRRVSGTGEHASRSLTEIAGADMPALRSVFARALTENPEARFATALEFAEGLNRAFPSMAVEVLPASAPSRPVARTPEPLVSFVEPRLPLDDIEADREPEPEIEIRDLDLRNADDARDEDLAVAPAIVVDDADSDEDTRRTRVSPVPEPDFSAAAEPAVETVPSSVIAAAGKAVRPTPSRTWPLVMMLLFGIVAGLAAGYLVWSRPDPVAPTQTVVAEPPKPAASSGREFTESAVQNERAAAAAAAAAGGRAGAPADRSSVPTDRSLPASDRAEVGRLLVRSTPAGATVFVDGREHGETPVAIRDLAHGAHHLRLVHDGYAPAERRVVITTSQPAQSIFVPLAEARATASGGTRSPGAPVPTTPATLGRYSGSLVIESKPAGARVYLDNKLAGTTPVSIPNVAAGSHVVRLERDGYRRWSSSVRVVAAERNRITASLEQ